jgi:hypothetical protein
MHAPVDRDYSWDRPSCNYIGSYYTKMHAEVCSGAASVSNDARPEFQNCNDGSFFFCCAYALDGGQKISHVR